MVFREMISVSAPDSFTPTSTSSRRRPVLPPIPRGLPVMASIFMQCSSCFLLSTWNDVPCPGRRIIDDPGPPVMQLLQNLLHLLIQSMFRISRSAPLAGHELLDHLPQDLRIDPVQRDVNRLFAHQHNSNCPITAGRRLGALIRSCLLTFIRPNMTWISPTATPNSSARKRTIWSVALPARGTAVTLTQS